MAPDFIDDDRRPAHWLTSAELMRRHGAGGMCPICEMLRCPAYAAARIEDCAEPARTFDAAVRDSYGPPWSGAGTVDVGQARAGAPENGC